MEYALLWHPVIYPSLPVSAKHTYLCKFCNECWMMMETVSGKFHTYGAISQPLRQKLWVLTRKS